MKRQHIKLKNTPQVKKYNQALRRASKIKMNKRKKTGIDWSKKDMYEGIGRPDLKPRENKMKKLKKNLREEFDKKWKTVRYSEKKSEYLFLGKFQTRNEIGNALWSWIEKALQAKEEEVVGEIEKLKQQDEDNPFQTCFECESTMSIYGECPHCGSPIRYADNDYNQAIDDILSSLKKGETK